VPDEIRVVCILERQKRQYSAYPAGKVARVSMDGNPKRRGCKFVKPEKNVKGTSDYAVERCQKGPRKDIVGARC
jgi:hypothetical protein